MLWLFELAKEFQQLPQEEVMRVLHAEGIFGSVVVSNEDVVVVDAEMDADQVRRVVNRVALSMVIDECWIMSEPDMKVFAEAFSGFKMPVDGSVAVHARNRSVCFDSRPLVRFVAEQVTGDREVDLEHPEVDVRVVVTDGGWYVGCQRGVVKRKLYEQRRVHHRPYFLPISLHPKLARALVNLSEIQYGGRLLDPFCGTGGLLIEAGMVGARVIGNDIEEKMVEGCRKTFDHFGIREYQLFQQDVGVLSSLVDPVDAIVTDLPYGKSTTTKGEKLAELYTRAFRSFIELVKPGGMMVVGGSLPEIGHIAEQFFQLECLYTLRVHRSLTRYFVVCRR